MFDKLEQLRAKPPHIKKHIAFWSAAGITAVILVFWTASLGVTLQNQQVAELDGDVYVNQPATSGSSVGTDGTSGASGTPSPVSALTASVSDAFAPVAAIFKSIISDISSDAHPQATSSAVEIYAAPSAPTQNAQNVISTQGAPMQTYQ